MKSGTRRRLEEGLVKNLFKTLRSTTLTVFLCCWSVSVVLFSAPLLAAPWALANDEGTQLWRPDPTSGLKAASADRPFTTTGDPLEAEARPSNIMLAQGWHPVSPVQDPLCAQFLRLFLQKEKDVNALQPSVNLVRTLEGNVELFSKEAEDVRKEAEQAYKDLWAKAGVVKTMVYTYCLPFKENGKEAVPELARVRAAAINLPPSQGLRERINAANKEVEDRSDKFPKYVSEAESAKIATEQARVKVLQRRDELRREKQPIRDFIIDWYQRAPNCIKPSTEDINRNLDSLKNRLPDVVEKDLEALEKMANKALDRTRELRDNAHFICYEYAAKLPALCELRLILTKKADKANIHPGEKTIYTYTLANPTKWRAFSDVRPVDNVCSPLRLVSGDTANAGQLDPGETWTYTCEQTLSNTTTNMATAEAVFKMKVLADTLVSATVKSSTVTATVTVAPDTTPPTVTAFALPTMWGSLRVPIRTFTATDDVAVTGYMVTDTPTAPTPGHTSWKPTPQTSFTFSSQGTKTLYAWAKDGAGNVSASLNASVVIQPLMEVPNVIGQMGHTARKMIVDHNLVVGVIRQMMSNSPTSTVISQNPLGHTPAHPSLVPPGTRVDIWISQAFPTGPGTVPNVVGMTVQEATNTIIAAGYTPSNAGSQPSDLAVGLVCSQNPEWGQAAAPGSTVSFWVTSNVPKYLYLDPPRATLKIGQQVSFTVTLAMKDGSNQVLTPNQVQWDPGPLSQFTCVKPGKFIVWARFGDAHGSATVTCEEDWSVPAFEPPISRAGDRDAKVPTAGQGDYTWYAFCEPRTGEVTYGQDLLTGRKIMAGPFPGPRTAYDWIAKNCSTWRCNTDGTCALTPAMGGEWKVLCGKNDLRIVLGKTYDFSRQILIKEGFLGEPDARAWAGRVYPNSMCLPDGRPAPASPPATAGTPRRAGRWAAVCDRRHGGVSLTEYPDPVRHWILGEGFFGEPDARMWTDQNCRSWRCDAQGKCLVGVAPSMPGDRPLELPPEPERGSGTDWWSDFAEGFRRGAGETAEDTRRAPEEARKVYTKPDPPIDPRPGRETSGSTTRTPDGGVDCGALRDVYFKKCAQMREPYVKQNCAQGRNYSGCALDPQGCMSYVIVDALPNGKAQARVNCGRGVIDQYISCLTSCNQGLIQKRYNVFTIPTCGSDCRNKAVEATKGCNAQSR